MPMHTDNTAKVKRSYSQNFPKNLMDYSAKVDNKFLNDNLHTIEEMEYRKKGITDGFRNYQNKHYGNREILNHDLYFTHEGKTYPKVSGAALMGIKNIGFIGSLDVKVNGANLTAGGTALHTNLASYIYAGRLSSGTIGEYYNQISVNVFATGSGSINLAVYDDDGASPSKAETVYGETGSFTAATGITEHSLSEFDLVTAQNWSAVQTTASDIYYSSAANAGSYKAHSYVAFTSTGFTSGGDAPDQTVSHT